MNRLRTHLRNQRLGTLLCTSILFLTMFVICAAQFSNSPMTSVANTFLFMAGASTVTTISLAQILISSLIEIQPSTVNSLKELLEEREYRINQLIYNIRSISDHNWSGEQKQTKTRNDGPSGEVHISMISDISEAASIKRFLAQGKTVVLNFVEFGAVNPEEFLDLIRQSYSPEQFKLTAVDDGILVLTPTLAPNEFAIVNETSEAPPKLLNEGSMGKVFPSEIPSAERKPEVDQEVNELTG